MLTLSRRFAVLFGFATVLLLLHCTPVLAAWQHDGIPLSPPGVTAGPSIGRDATGGLIVAWANDSIHLEVHALRVSADGSNASGWSYGGVDIADIPPGLLYSVLGIGDVLPDGDGGAYVVYNRAITAGTNGSIARVLGTGVVAPGWPLDGAGDGPLGIAPDDAGGVLYAYGSPSRFGFPSSYLFKRRRGDATLAGAYVPTVNATNDPASIDTDHAGGAIGACLCELTGLDTTMAVRWNGSPWPGCTGGLKVVSDGDHGAFLVWYAGSSVKVARVDQAGDLVSGWNPNGVTVGTLYVSSSASLAYDGTGGCFVMWRGAGGYMVQRFTATGSIVPGWPASGAPIGAAATIQAVTRMVPDGAGGLYVGWGNLAQHLDSAGAPVAGWAATGSPISQAPGSKTNLTAASDDAGGVYFAWRDGRTNPPQVYGQHLLASDVILLSAPLAQTTALAIVPLANPSARVIKCSVMLPSSAPARMEVFDTLGRRVSGQIIGGAVGARVASIDVAGSSAGVYLVRVSQGAHSVATRVVLIQ